MKRLLLGMILVAISGCATVRVTAQTDGRCRMRTAAPFEVRCWSDGQEVLVWTGSGALVIEEAKP